MSRSGPTRRSLNQRVRVLPAIEGERVGRAKQNGQNGLAKLPPLARTLQDSGPLRCQLWDGRNHLTTLPLRFDDMGNIDDLMYRPTSAIRITKLVFVWGGRVFVHPLAEPQIILKGQSLHLALKHLRLLDKFGIDALKAGRK